MKKEIFVEKTFILKILSPIHVGYGEEFDAFSFVVDDREKNILVVDMDKFFTLISSDETQRFLNICKEAEAFSLIKLYRFMSSKLELVKSHPDIILRKIPFCNGFLNHYNRVKSLPKDKIHELNKFNTYMLSYNVNLKSPVIPGSSIKGSIRTAILNHFRDKISDELRIRIKRQEYRRLPKLADTLEKEILGYSKPNEDIMKRVKVSDFLPVGKVKTKIFYGICKKKTGDRSRAPYQMFEVIMEGCEFKGSILVYPDRNKKVEISHSILEQSLKEFYGKIYREEDKIYSRLQTKKPLPYTGLPLKVGRHSGAEATTVEGFRKIKIKRGKWDYIEGEKSTTMWFCSEYSKNRQNNSLRPFGWVELISEGSLNKAKRCDKKNEKLDFSSLKNKFTVVSKK